MDRNEHCFIFPKILLRCLLYVGFTHNELLAGNVQRWHDRATAGMSWPGCGLGPAALSLGLEWSCRQGHMPEGELATLLPFPPRALLNPYLLFLPYLLPFSSHTTQPLLLYLWVNVHSCLIPSHHIPLALFCMTFSTTLSIPLSPMGPLHVLASSPILLSYSMKDQNTL